MKKVYVIFAIVLCLFVGIKSYSAMSEEKLKEVMNEKITINGSDYILTDEVKVYVERYLNEYDVNEEDCQYIADRVVEAKNIAKTSGKSKVKDLSRAQKDELKALVEKISANTSINATVSDGSLIVYKPTGGVFAVIDEPIKYTGSEMSPVAVIAGVAFLITLAGACLVVRQVKEN